MKISKRFTFEAAHKLNQHDGKCQRLHGHSWVMIVTMKGHINMNVTDPKRGMVMDYGDIKSLVKPIVDEKLDHHYLNETLPCYPTSENVAVWMFEQVNASLRKMQDKPGCPPHYDHVILQSIEIQETCTSSALVEFTT